MPKIWINIRMKQLILLTFLILFSGCTISMEDKWFQKEWDKLDKEVKKNDNN